MSWFATYDAQARSGRPERENAEIAGASDDASLLARGTLVLEYEASGDTRAPRRLLHYQASHGWERRFTVYLNADHSLAVEAQQGPTNCYVSLANSPRAPSGPQRLTYAWDAPARRGFLALEKPETGQVQSARLDAPVPLPLGDARALLRHDRTQIDSCVSFAALSERPEPIGPSATIGAGAMIETPDGARAIERLRLGDQVLTRDNGAQTIRWILQQDRPACGPHAPIQLCTPYFGLTADLMVSPGQRIVIAGALAEYTFGNDAVLIPAQHLASHTGATVLPTHDTVTYRQILLDNHECIQVNGAWCDSLYVGRLADTPDILHLTGLAAIPEQMMPRHDGYVHPVLKTYESRAVLDSMIA